MENPIDVRVSMLSGFSYEERFHEGPDHQEHLVRTRLGTPVLAGEGGAQIVIVDGGMRVDFAGIVGRPFRSISGLSLVEGKPLYTARLPRGETDFWRQEAVVYGTTEYLGPERVAHVLGVVGGHPLFYGVTWEDRDLFHHHVVHGARHTRTFDRISDQVQVLSGLLAYAGAQRNPVHGQLDWFAVIDDRSFGPYDREPNIAVTAWGGSPVGAGVVAERVRLQGRYRGQKRTQEIRLRPFLARRPLA